MSDGKRGVPDVVVAFDITTFTTTDKTGHFELRVPDGQKGIVWVRVPDGFRPGAVWSPWEDPGRPADGSPPKPSDVALALHPLPQPLHQPLTFALASDSHLSIAQTFNGAEDLAIAATAATAADPALFAILGDITQGGKAPEFDLVDAALSGLASPWVSVPGNHDWYDNGVNWFKRYGPDNYSFDVANVHFVVWNLALDDATIRAFLTAELARVPRSMTIVGLTHAPPSPALIETLKRLGVAYVLTGHAHSNRVVDHVGLVELNTEPLLMGGLDFTPAGYRIVTIANGALTSYHRTTVDEPVVAVMAPGRGQCVPATGGDVVVAAELDASEPIVTARIDCASPIALRRAGGWDWRAKLPPLAAGTHVLTIGATSATGMHGAATASFTVCAAPSPPARGADWPQLGGNARHDGATSHVLAPPLATRWVTPVGGHLLSASPAIANGIVYATVTDLADGNTGGVVAVDLRTGAIVWRSTTDKQVRGGPAVIGETVVVPLIDGVVLGFDATTGAQRWRYQLGEHVVPEAAALFASVAADGEDALIGHQRMVAAIDAARGTQRWRFDPVPEGENSQSLAAIAIGFGIAVGTFNRLWDGVQAWDRATAAPLWQRVDDDTIAINATPVIAGDEVIVVDAADVVTARDLATGELRWRAALDPAGFEWGNATIGTPAVAHGIVIVPTLYRDVVALDAATGEELWRHAGLPSAIRATHYRGAGQAGYEASPVIAGSIVWVADTSGELAALDLHSGTPLWRMTVGAPVLSGLATSGDWLVVGSYDGTLRGLAPAQHDDVSIAPAACEATRAPVGCTCATDPPSLAVLALVGALLLRRRSARATR